MSNKQPNKSRQTGPGASPVSNSRQWPGAAELWRCQTKKPINSMRIRILTLAIAIIALTCHAEDLVLRDFGTVRLKDHGVTIELTQKKPFGLAVRMTFDASGSRGLGTTGTGDDSSIPIAQGKWAVEFVAPNELWIYDGLSAVMLYEHTISPAGFKASASPELLKRAPKALLDLMAENRGIES
jgi:hypothetical protein